MEIVEDDARRQSMDARARARQSISHAQAAFLKAKQESQADLIVNEFARDQVGEIELQGKATKRGSGGSGKWFASIFSRRQSPKSTRELQLWSGETLHWEKVASGALTEVKDLSVMEGKWSEPKKAFWTRHDVTIETQPGPDGLVYTRVKAKLALEPRMLLASQTQARLRGCADPELIYMREHWRFRFGRTIVCHQVRKIGGRMSAARDFCDIITYEEQPDGSFVLAETSVSDFLPNKAVKGCVRGVTRIRGMVIKPATFPAKGLFGKPTQGSEVTFVCCYDPKGWLPISFFNRGVGKAAAQYLVNCETVVSAMTPEEQDLLFDDDE